MTIIRIVAGLFAVSWAYRAVLELGAAQLSTRQGDRRILTLSLLVAGLLAAFLAIFIGSAPYFLPRRSAVTSMLVALIVVQAIRVFNRLIVRKRKD